MMASTVPKKQESQATAMSTTRDPFASIRDEMSELMSRIWSGQTLNYSGIALNPAMDVSEHENAFEIHADIPGMKVDDFDIRVRGNAVTISGKRREEQEEEHEEQGKTFYRSERRSGSFSRTMTLPCDVNADEVAAEYDNGVLKLTLPKLEESQPRKINVRS